MFGSLVVFGFFYYGLFSSGTFYSVLWGVLFVAAFVALVPARRGLGNLRGLCKSAVPRGFFVRGVVFLGTSRGSYNAAPS